MKEATVFQSYSIVEGGVVFKTDLTKEWFQFDMFIKQLSYCKLCTE